MTTDEGLMLQFQQGSREAFTQLFERYRESLYGFFRRRVPDPGRAEDLAQETFLAVLRNSTRYEPRAPVRSYLFGIAFKLVSVEHRRAPNVPLNLEREEDRFTTEDRESLLWVRQALERLDPAEREIVMLREYEQLSYAEIAGVLGIPVNTVRSRLFRARMALKELLVATRDQRCVQDEGQGKPFV